MFLEEPFPAATAWVTANSSADESAEIEEYLHAVRYHLSVGANAERAASAALRPGEWGISHTGDAIYVVGFDPYQVVQYGDQAIREAGTVVDVALQFTNRALNTGLAKESVRWGRGASESALQAYLRKGGRAEDQALMASIDAVFDSIGLRLLHDYRHWVTHRGAPRVQLDYPLPGPIALDDEIKNEADERRKVFLIETKLSAEIPTAMRIECYPFVPPVESVISLSVENAPDDIEIPGLVRIEKGASLEIRDATTTRGSPMESVADFTAKNPITREESRVRLAGEDLAVYKAWDYIHAILFAMQFVNGALRGDWDEKLTLALASRA